MPDPEDLTREQILERFLKVGDTITHTRCLDCIEEHIYDGHDGHWLTGIPTADTMRLGDLSGNRFRHRVNDIGPNNVTHINRVPVDAVPFLAQFKRED